jgi:hypothetical protein
MAWPMIDGNKNCSKLQFGHFASSSSFKDRIEFILWSFVAKDESSVADGWLINVRIWQRGKEMSPANFILQKDYISGNLWAHKSKIIQ